jgi:transcriptional regulator with XRE-family HTH domain
MPHTTKHPTIGERIKSARVAASMTQLQLAHALGRTGDDAGAYISRVESGETEPRVETLQRIAEALGVTLGELV